MNETDLQLLRRYSQEGSEDAFAEIVHRHLNLVYSAALRQLHSPQLAEEVAQSVFTDLAQQAERLAQDTVVTAWLYTVTCRTAVDVIRREARRQEREQIAQELNAMNAITNDWTRIEPLLDEAMHTLDNSDRAAVLLRYFEDKSFREVGQAIGTSEDAARKRIGRAIESLRDFFSSRGVTVESSGLALVLSTHAIQQAPIGLKIMVPAAFAAKGMIAAGGKGVGISTKAGVGTKAAMLGGLLAVVGGALVTLRAQVSDTKSPREAHFLLQMIGVRILAIIGALPVFFVLQKFSGTPFIYDIAFAVFLFAMAVVMTLFLDYTSRRQRQIQLEDGTWVKAEWEIPRQAAESSANAGQGRLQIHLKAARFMAFFLVWFVVMAVAGPWRRDWVRALTGAVALTLVLFLAFRNWLSSPRFRSLRLKELAAIACTMCGLTLLEYNLRETDRTLWDLGGGVATARILFNLVVILAYAAFVGLFIWKRKSTILPISTSGGENH